MEAVAAIATDSGPKKGATTDVRHLVDKKFCAAYIQILSPATRLSKPGTSAKRIMPATDCQEGCAQVPSTGSCGARNA